MEWNWYDIVVAVALLWGLWSGVRNGFFGEILRVAGVVAMLWLAARLYIPAGNWLQRALNVPEEPARLVAFVVIAIGVYLLACRLRDAVHVRMKKFQFGAFLENFGGALAGMARMGIVMAFLTIVISLMRSPFWHEQVSTNSRFGSYVVSEFPEVAELVKKEFEETLWFKREIERRDEPSVED